jgi:glycosyltransferase involved in cell wall biosynthesis
MGAEGLLARRTDAFLFESEYVRGRFERYVGGTDRLVRVVHNGIAPAEFEPLQRDPDPFDLVYIGELRPAKGIETLIDALAILRRDHGRRLTLLTVGSGPSEPDLQARAKAAGVWDSTAFVPPQPIRAALSRGRVMVIPSKAESLPYVILEAAACGQPLVSTNVGGIGEIFGPYSDQLIPPDDPALLATRVLAKMDEPESARRAAAVALSQHVRERFCIDRMVDGMLDGYRDAAEARERRR